MANYICKICNRPIIDYSDGLFVKIQNPSGNLLKTVPVHKGTCDDTLKTFCINNELDAKFCMEISFFNSDEERMEYMNSTFSMNDNEICDKYFNEYGTLKAD